MLVPGAKGRTMTSAFKSEAGRRIGRFTVSTELVESAPDMVLAVMAGAIVLKCEANGYADVFEYVAISPHFREKPLGEIVPFYVFELTTAEDGTVSVVRAVEERRLYESQFNKLAGALRELVACKDLADRIKPAPGFPRGAGGIDRDHGATIELAAEYDRREPLAWEAARQLLKALP